MSSETELEAAKAAICEFLLARQALDDCPVESLRINAAFARHDAAIEALRAFAPPADTQGEGEP